MAKIEKKIEMMQAAIDLFHQQGVNATSIDQILAKSKTGKSQFTHYFKTKDGLVHASLTYLCALIREGKTETGYEIKTWRDMDKWFQSYIDFQKSVDFERSCPIGTIGNDIKKEQKALRKTLIIFLQWSRAQLGQFFKERKIAGELRANIEPEELADFCISIMQGGMLLTKMKRNSDMFENAAKHARAYLKSLQ